MASQGRCPSRGRLTRCSRMHEGVKTTVLKESEESCQTTRSPGPTSNSGGLTASAISKTHPEPARSVHHGHGGGDPSFTTITPGEFWSPDSGVTCPGGGGSTVMSTSP